MSEAKETVAADPQPVPSNGHVKLLPGTPPDAVATPNERAEEIVDQIGERVGHYVTIAGHALLRFFARPKKPDCHFPLTRVYEQSSQPV
jgi:hypothetical protein